MEETGSPQLRDRNLLSLEGKELEGLALHVELGAVSAAGARYFELSLQEPGSELVHSPALRGSYRLGHEPAGNWVEVVRSTIEGSGYSVQGTGSGVKGQGSRVEGSGSWGQAPGEVPHTQGSRGRSPHDSRPSTLDPRECPGAGCGLDSRPAKLDPIEEALFKALADLVPAGGHMMVEYETRPDTEKALALGVPPAATALGGLLLRAGCGTAFKDWYFSEGWTEGPRKLQGYKALDPDHAHRRARATAVELLDFLSRPHDPRHEGLLGPARRRAVEVLKGIRTGDAELDWRIDEAVAAVA